MPQIHIILIAYKQLTLSIAWDIFLMILYRAILQLVNIPHRITEVGIEKMRCWTCANCGIAQLLK